MLSEETFRYSAIIKRWSVWRVPSAWQANQVHRQGHGAPTIRICVAHHEVFTRHHQRPICYHALSFVLRPNRILLDFAIKGCHTIDTDGIASRVVANTALLTNGGNAVVCISSTE